MAVIAFFVWWDWKLFAHGVALFDNCRRLGPAGLAMAEMPLYGLANCAQHPRA